MEFITAVIILIALTVLAYWRGNPAIYMICAGIAMMSGLYAPDALKGLDYSSFGVSIGLMLIAYALICVGLAYGNMFRPKGE